MLEDVEPGTLRDALAQITAEALVDGFAVMLAEKEPKTLTDTLTDVKAEAQVDDWLTRSQRRSLRHRT